MKDIPSLQEVIQNIYPCQQDDLEMCINEVVKVVDKAAGWEYSGTKIIFNRCYENELMNIKYILQEKGYKANVEKNETAATIKIVWLSDETNGILNWPAFV